MNFIIKAALRYLESHPEQVERLIDALVHALIEHLTTPAAPAPVL
jgi:hypothetical protein